MHVHAAPVQALCENLLMHDHIESGRSNIGICISIKEQRSVHIFADGMTIFWRCMQLGSIAEKAVDPS
jgi:hypothetical protein